MDSLQLGRQYEPKGMTMGFVNDIFYDAFTKKNKLLKEELFENDHFALQMTMTQAMLNAKGLITEYKNSRKDRSKLLFERIYRDLSLNSIKDCVEMWTIRFSTNNPFSKTFC